MKRIGILLSFVAACVAFYFLRGNPSFHRDFPTSVALLNVVDEMGRPIRAEAELTTRYWYPGLVGTAQTKDYIDRFVPDEGGNLRVVRRVHHQIQSVKLVVSAVGYQSFTTTIGTEAKRRIALVATNSEPLRQQIWGGNGFGEELAIEWTEKPLWISFQTNVVSTNVGDIKLEIERPTFEDIKKIDKPLTVRVSYPNGLLQLMDRYDVELQFQKGIGAWGDTNEIVRHIENSHGIPAFWETFAFSSTDRTVRGGLIIACNPVGEWKENRPIVKMRISGRVYFYGSS